MIKLIEMVGMSNLGALWNLKLKFLDKMYRRHQQVGVASGRLCWAEIQWGYISDESWCKVPRQEYLMQTTMIGRRQPSTIKTYNAMDSLRTSHEGALNQPFLHSMALCQVRVIAVALCQHHCSRLPPPLFSDVKVGSLFLQLLKSNGEAFPPTSEDKFLWYLNPLLPESLPKPVMQQGRKFDHHLIMEMTELPRCISRIIRGWKHRTFGDVSWKVMQNDNIRIDLQYVSMYLMMLFFDDNTNLMISRMGCLHTNASLWMQL